MVCASPAQRTIYFPHQLSCPRRRTVQIYNVRQIKHQGQELYKTNPDGKYMCAMKCITRYTRESGCARNHTLMQSIKYYYSTFGGLDASDRPRDYGTNVLDAMYSKLDWCVGDGWKMSVCVCVRYRVWFWHHVAINNRRRRENIYRICALCDTTRIFIGAARCGGYMFYYIIHIGFDPWWNRIVVRW